eukprot:NP_001024766.1 Uncharacterized protein CELE_K06G5.1 [Caenorhabditis elegans]
MLTFLILSWLAFSGTDAGTDADCSCYNKRDSNVTGTKIGLSNGYKPDNFETCYPDAGCGFIADSGGATGWSTITVTFSTPTDTTGKFTLYNGKVADNSTKITTFTVADSGTTKSYTSSTQYIYVEYTQDNATSPNAYYGSIGAGGLLPPSTITPPSTTAAPTTTPYTNPNFGRDPQLISHDILIMVNQRTTQGSDGLAALNSLAKSFVNLLSVTDDITSLYKTRLGLATVTPYSPFYAAQGEIWKMSAADVNGSLPNSGVSIDVDITTALSNAVNTFFNVSITGVSNPAPTRKNVQRSILLFTAWWSESQTPSEDLQKKFAAKGVNLAIIGYNTSPGSLNSNDWFYLNSGLNNNLTNNWCKIIADANANNSISEPSDFFGPPKNGASWGTDNGQKSRYCNFQDSTYTYQRKEQDKLVTLTVFYELEVEKDFLKFFADGVEIESFTGVDVNNASFDVDANIITARFTSDAAGIQRGFSVTFEETKSKPTS